MLCTSLLLSAILAQSSAADAATAEKAKIENRAMLESDFKSLQRETSRPIREIVNITMEDGNLHVQSRLPPTQSYVECDAADWPGRLQIDVGPVGSLIMHLKHVQLIDGDSGAVITDVITAPDYLQISCDRDTPDGMLSVSLVQAGKFADENKLPTRVNVQRQRIDGPTDRAVWSGTSLAALRKEHPAELRKYLLPVLTDLGAGALLRSSDAMSAWQVLGAEIPVDAAIDQKLRDILQRLNADDFATRGKANEALVALGPVGAAALGKIDLSKLPADPRAAVDLFIRRQQPLSPDDAKANLTSLSFLLDTVLLDDPLLRKAALSRIAKLTGEPLEIPESADYRAIEKRVDAYAEKFEKTPTTNPLPISSP